MSFSGTCPRYSNFGSFYTWCGPFRACPGDIIKLGDCDACTGDTFLSLYNADYNYLACGSNFFNSCGDDYRCASMTYSVPMSAPCQDYRIHQTCGHQDEPCSGTTSYSVTATLQFAYLSIYSLLHRYSWGRCDPSRVLLRVENVFAKVTCDSLSSSSPWTITTYQSSDCNPSSVINTKRYSNSCGCSALGDSIPLDDYASDLTMTINCGSRTAPPRPSSCNFMPPPPPSSGGLSSAAVGGIVVGGVLVLIVVGLWISRVIGIGGAFSYTAAATTTAAGTDAADVEIVVNPMAPITEA